MSHRATLTGLLGLALLARALVAALTAIPGRDGAHYLWMAEQAAAGHPAALFQTVFHPGYPVLVAVPIALGNALGLGIEPFAWAQMVALTAGALALVPLYAVSRRLYDERTAVLAALLYAIGTWFCRHPAEALSEGPFYLCVALWAERLIGSTNPARVAVAGIAAALAYACRPEGAALPILAVLWLWSNGRRADCGWILLAFTLGAAPLPIGWAIAGAGFTLTPKASFNYDVGIGQPGGGPGHYFQELAALPGAALESLGFLVLPLALLGAIRGGAYVLSSPRALLFLPFVVQCLVIPMLRAHYRFVSGFGILLLPLASAAVLEIARTLAARPRLVVSGLLVLVASEVVRLPRARGHDRIIERDLGRFLGRQLQPGEAIATDMPRLAYFAGLRPPPPRPIAPAEILATSQLATTRYVVLVRRRTPLPAGALATLGYRPVTLPHHLASLVAERDAVVFERRR